MIRKKNNRYKYFIIAVYLGFSAISCKTLPPATVAGKYIYKDDVKRLTLTLKNNQEFEYLQEMSLNYTRSKGKWTELNNILTFHSYENYRSNYIEVVESYSKDNSYIQLVDDEGYGIHDAEITINDDKTRLVADIDGKIFYKNDAVDSIYFQLIGLDQVFYRVKDKRNNVFIIKAIQTDYSKSYFNGEKAIFKKKGITFKNLLFTKD